MNTAETQGIKEFEEEIQEAILTKFEIKSTYFDLENG